MRFAATLGALLVVALAGCIGGVPRQPIAIGAVYNLSGAQAVLDVPSSNGSMLAVSQINAKGGVLDGKLSLVPIDGRSDPAVLAAATSSALSSNPNMAAFVGLSDTDQVLAAAPLAAAVKRVFLSSGATSPDLPRQIPEFLFLACFGDNVQAAAAAEWAYGDLGARSAAILYDPSLTYTDLLQGYFADRFASLGGTVATSAAFDPRATPLQVPPTGDVDIVFLGVQTADDAARVVPLLRAAGYSGPIVGGDGYDAEAVWAAAPEIADVYFTTHVYLGADNQSATVAAFVSAYASAYPGQDPGAFAALGYDAIGLLEAAMERAGDTTPAAIEAGLTGLHDYAGVTGTISFPGESRIPTKSVTIIRVAGGEQHFVANVLPEVVPNP